MLPETYLSLAALPAVVAACGAAYVLVRSGDRLRHRLFAAAATAVAFALVTAAIIVRWRAIGHPPVFGSYENSLACAWFLLLGSWLLLALPGAGNWRWSAIATLPWVGIVLLWGLRFNRNRIDLTISERSIWIDIHAAVAWAAYVLATVALAVALLAIVQRLGERHGRVLGGALPPPRWSEEMLAQSVTWTFIGITAILATGSWYSWLLFGTVWRWDIVEVLVLVAWLTFGLAVHVRLFYGWRAFGLAWIVAVGYVLLLAAFWALALLPLSSYHFFELPF